MKMKYDITAIGNALVDTQFKVSHEFIAEVGLEIDQMNLSSAKSIDSVDVKAIASSSLQKKILSVLLQQAPRDVQL